MLIDRETWLAIVGACPNGIDIERLPLDLRIKVRGYNAGAQDRPEQRGDGTSLCIGGCGTRLQTTRRGKCLGCVQRDGNLESRSA